MLVTIDSIMASEKSISQELFSKCIEEIAELSDKLLDGWKIHHKEDLSNGKYLTKKSTLSLGKAPTQVLVTFEYHIVYSVSYSVPMMCFVVWKQDGSMLSLEDYWNYNESLKGSNMYDTLTQLDHPVLCRPFLTLHPCKTHEVIQPFLDHSKNPVVSWLSIVAPFVHLKLLSDYLKYC